MAKKYLHEYIRGVHDKYQVCVSTDVDVYFEVDVDFDVAAKKEWNIKMPASGVEMGANYLSGASGTGICKYCNQQ